MDRRRGPLAIVAGLAILAAAGFIGAIAGGFTLFALLVAAVLAAGYVARHHLVRLWGRRRRGRRR